MEYTQLQLLFFVQMLLSCFLACLSQTQTSITTDQLSLLDFKSQISFDSNSILATNWSAGTDVCSWFGVSCTLSSNNRRVSSLHLPNMNLRGNVSSTLGNLSFLTILSVGNNSLGGELPNELSFLKRLTLIDFASNMFSGVLPSWIGAYPELHTLSVSNNKFTGTIPSSLGNLSKVEIFSMGNNRLTGGIPSEIGNLTLLRELRLHLNNLRGEIPKEIGQLRNLQIFSISDNLLTGPLPSSVYNMSALELLYLTNNSLSGSFPPNMCDNLQSLRELTLFNNKFEGSIPRGIGNCSSLTTINLGSNSFTGTIPHEIGSLNELEILFLPINQFSGEIPFEIFNNTKMTYISLTSNLLTGELPPTMGLWLPNIQKLILTNNSISGTIPRFITNATNLIQLDLGFNSFTGYIPDTLGDLRLLEWLGLGSNDLSRDPSDPGMGFLTSLTKCRYLEKLGFEGTALDAALPNTIGNFSASLQQFFAYGCQLIGGIPDEIGNLSNLVTLQLWRNKLTGYIPATLGKLQELQDLSLSGNNLSGPIPVDIFSIRNLAYLRLSENELSGAIPHEIGNLTSIRVLVLAGNKFTSSIPSTLWNLEDVLNLDLTLNLLTGSIPMELVNLKSAWQIGLSGNQLTGNIPEITKDLGSLIGLFLDRNRLQGPIPDSVSNLVGLEYLDLSDNSLEGDIPKSVTKLINLKNFNVSFNNLVGEVPGTGPFANFSAALFAMNKGLCGGAPQMHLPPCKTVDQQQPRSRQLLLKIGTPVLACLAILLAFLFLWIRRITNKRSAGAIEEPEDYPLAVTRITYQEILQATNGLGETNLLGTGGFGSVYKGILPNGTTVAIKVFNTQNPTALKTFQSECEILRSIRHKNLLKIISTCSNNLDFMAIVLEYMPNGNLSTLLHSNTNSLTLIQRINIMLDVASAIKYLHHDLPTPVIHCDLKPSNILLDHHLTAHVADFGISKLLSQNQSLTQTLTLATVGYMAPEYGGAGVVTAKGDVFSYGVVLMETITGKKPTDDEFNDEVSLRDYVISSLKKDATDSIEGGLMDESDRRFEKCVQSVLSMALNCTEESPARRMSMYDVVSRLVKIRDEVLEKDVVQVRLKAREEEVGLVRG